MNSMTKISIRNFPDSNFGQAIEGIFLFIPTNGTQWTETSSPLVAQ
jgi:hypothetical protein